MTLKLVKPTDADESTSIPNPCPQCGRKASMPIPFCPRCSYGFEEACPELVEDMEALGMMQNMEDQT